MHSVPSMGCFLHTLQVKSILNAELLRNSWFYSTCYVRSPKIRHCCVYQSLHDHVTNEGHVTLFMYEHVVNAAILLKFWRPTMDSWHVDLARSGKQIYSVCIRAIATGWQVFFTYDQHLTDRCFENCAFLRGSHDNNKGVRQSTGTMEIADDMSLELII